VGGRDLSVLERKEREAEGHFFTHREKSGALITAYQKKSGNWLYNKITSGEGDRRGEPLGSSASVISRYTEKMKGSELEERLSWGGELRQTRIEKASYKEKLKPVLLYVIRKWGRGRKKAWNRKKRTGETGRHFGQRAPEGAFKLPS